MIKAKTVLVLGAGSSAHVGYPLGSRLVANLCALRGSAALKSLPNEWADESVNDFLTRLSRSGHYSIDAFLETVPDQADLGKYLIARELKKYEKIDALFPPNSIGSWYQHLFNALLPDAGSPRLQCDHLSIISFNYDRSLEAYLHHAIQARFSLSSTDAAEILRGLPIVHVHGILGSYPDVPYEATEDPDVVLTAARQIQIIYEIKDVEDGFCTQEFAKANEMLAASERIYFLGFGFHKDNLRRLKFFTPESMAARLFKCTTNGLGPVELQGLARRMKPFGFPEAALVPAAGYECNMFFSHIQELD